MKTFETTINVVGKKAPSIPMPPGLAPGEHAVVVIIDEGMIPLNGHTLHNFPVDHIGAFRPKDVTFRREEIYGDEGR